MVQSSRQYSASLLVCVLLTASVSFLTSLLNLKVSISGCCVYTSAYSIIYTMLIDTNKLLGIIFNFDRQLIVTLYLIMYLTVTLECFKSVADYDISGLRQR